MKGDEPNIVPWMMLLAILIFVPAILVHEDWYVALVLLLIFLGFGTWSYFSKD